jgi:hypothetical protein
MLQVLLSLGEACKHYHTLLFPVHLYILFFKVITSMHLYTHATH